MAAGRHHCHSEGLPLLIAWHGDLHLPERQVVALVVHWDVLVGGTSIQLIPGSKKGGGTWLPSGQPLCRASTSG